MSETINFGQRVTDETRRIELRNHEGSGRLLAYVKVMSDGKLRGEFSIENPELVPDLLAMIRQAQKIAAYHDLAG